MKTKQNKNIETGRPWLGATVRLKKGKQTATVERDSVTIGSGPIDGAVKLDKPLRGTQYWNVGDLVIVKPGPNRPENPKRYGSEKYKGVKLSWGELPPGNKWGERFWMTARYAGGWEYLLVGGGLEGLRHEFIWAIDNGMTCGELVEGPSIAKWSRRLPKKDGYYWMRMHGERAVAIWYWKLPNKAFYMGHSEKLTAGFRDTMEVEFWSEEILPPG